MFFVRHYIIFLNVGIDTKIEPPPDFFGHGDRQLPYLGRALLSTNSYVQSHP